MLAHKIISFTLICFFFVNMMFSSALNNIQYLFIVMYTIPSALRRKRNKTKGASRVRSISIPHFDTIEVL